MKIEILRDGQPVLPRAPGEPVEFHASDLIRTTFTNEDACMMLHVPSGYVVAKLPDFPKAIDCGKRPEITKGDLGHCFPPLGESEHVIETASGKIHMIRTCRDCGFAYGRFS